MTDGKWMGWSILTILVICFTITSCATKSTIKSQSVASSQQVQVKRILVAPPVIEYRDVNNGAAMEVPQEDRVRLCRALTTAIFDELSRKGVSSSGVVEPSAICQPSPDIHELYRIAKTQKNDRNEREEQMLSIFLKNVGETQVLFLRSRFHIGPGGYWNPINGAIASGSSRVVLDAYLFSPVERGSVRQYAAQDHMTPLDVEYSYKDIVKTLLGPIQQIQ
jgi:hypothetical protein